MSAARVFAASNLPRHRRSSGTQHKSPRVKKTSENASVFSFQAFRQKHSTTNPYHSVHAQKVEKIFRENLQCFYSQKNSPEGFLLRFFFQRVPSKTLNRWRHCDVSPSHDVALCGAQSVITFQPLEAERTWCCKESLGFILCPCLTCTQ